MGSSPVPVLRALLLACICVPLVLFAYATWATYKTVRADADKAILKNIDILQEHTLKVFETVDRSLAEVEEIVAPLDDAQIREQQAAVSERLSAVVGALPQIYSLTIVDIEGHPLVTSASPSIPADTDLTQREYFRGAVADRAQPFYISALTDPKLFKGPAFFALSRLTARPNASGRPRVVSAAVSPAYFHGFYAKTIVGPLDQAALVREDGSFLARIPLFDSKVKLAPTSNSMLALERQPKFDLLDSLSQVDNVDRRLGYRRVPGYPVYVQSAIETSTIQHRVVDAMVPHLYYGLPATLGLLGLCWLALISVRRAEREEGGRLRAEAALRESQRLEALGQLTGGVAHDFNNLLMVVQGNLDILRRRTTDDGALKRISMMERAVARGTGLTRQLLAFGRRQPLSPRAIALRGRLRRTADMLAPMLPGTVSLDIKVPDGVWPVVADPGEFEVALLNVAVNARDAMPDGGRMTLTARNVAAAELEDPALSGAFVAISLSDTGTGMSPEVLGRAFEPFFTTKPQDKGTGLGLSQVYGFAKQSGGTVQVASREGEGTVVTLYLPRSPTPATEAEEAPAPAGRPPGGQVLLAEDNPEVRAVVEGQLRDLGYAVTTATDAAAALEIFRRSRHFDLLVSDIVMPGEMNGIDLARAVRAADPAMRIILATGYSDRLEGGAERDWTILRKPFTRSDLEQVLARQSTAA